MIDKQKIKAIIEEVKTKWDAPKVRIVDVLKNRFKGLPQGDYEHSEALELVVRYMNRWENQLLVNTDAATVPETSAIKDGDKKDFFGMEDVNAIKFGMVKQWAIKQYIKSKGNYIFNAILSVYTRGKWINTEYRMNYLKHQIHYSQKRLFEKGDANDHDLSEINGYYVRGEYPDVFKISPVMISYTEAVIRLKEEYERLLMELSSEGEKNSPLILQGEIKGEKDCMGNIVVTLPMGELEKAILKKLEKQHKVNTVKNDVGDLHFYTRKQATDILHISLDTLNEWSNKGLLPKYKLGGKQVRYKREDIEKLFKKVEVIAFNKN
jgi:excisionase family DNA binding protein